MICVHFPRKVRGFKSMIPKYMEAFWLCPSPVPGEDTEEMSPALFRTPNSKVWGFGEPEKKLLCLGHCCKSPVNVKQLQFSIGLSVPENGTGNSTFVLGGFKKSKVRGFQAP